MDLRTKERYLIEAYSDENFISNVNTIRIEIEGELKKFISFLKEKLYPEQKIYENIESRLKSIESFQEKIYRKDYIKNWDVKDNIEQNQNLISTNLPDLIGFRINCFFWQDESVIYSLIQSYYNNNMFEGFTLNFDENKEQKNGHIIYKLSGIYKEKYCFEIQIKSIMHNIWGEVEHKTIYKNREYDTDSQNKKAITEQIFNILQASDKQLISLFKKHNDKKQLIYAIFYEETKTIVQEHSRTDVLAVHYNAYFQLFDDYKIIKKYVAYRLLGQPFTKEAFSTKDYDGRSKLLKESIVSEFLEYNLRCLYYIFTLLYQALNFDDFMLKFSQRLIDTYFSEEPQDNEDDAFAESEETNKNYNEVILDFLEDKIGGRKKND